MRLPLVPPVLSFSLILACGPATDGQSRPWPGTEPPALPAGFEFTAAAPCADSFEGFARFVEDGAERGLGTAGERDQRGRSTVLARDLDGDGDIDLVYSTATEEQPDHSVPTVFENLGSGTFARAPVAPLDTFQQASPSTFLAADLDGDDLPELLLGSESRVLVLDNLGGLDFASPRTLAEVGPTLLAEVAPEASGLSMKFTMGDADGDGDLDLAVLGGPPALPPEEGGEEAPADSATPEILLLLEGGELSSQQLLVSPGGGTLSLAGTFTDRDGDGDQDLLVTTDLNLVGSFWRNDGLDAEGTLSFVDDAAEVGADLEIAAMGVDSADLNGDGLLDYCITDTAAPSCLLSDGVGGFYEGGAALGLSPEVPVGAGGTLGWGFDLADLDHDGLLDAVQASGRAGNLGAPEYDADYPDLIWQGQEGGGFADATEEVGFGDVGDNYGLTTADLDGDGWLELVLLSSERVPLVYGNRCGPGAWLEVDLRGPPGNTEGYGAKVEVVSGTSQQIRELTSLRGLGQGPARVHFGLGDLEEAEQLRVLWPDGASSEAVDVPLGGSLAVTHPALLE